MSNFGSLFEQCGKFFLPGKEPLGNPLPPITPTGYDPTGTGGGDPTLGEIKPPQAQPLFKCEERFVNCPDPFSNVVERIVKTCVQCTIPGTNPPVPLLSLITSPVGFEDCKFRVPTCDDVPGEPPCVGMQFICPDEERKFRCEEREVLCPPQAGGDRKVRKIEKTCLPCEPLLVGEVGQPNVFPEDCIYRTPDCVDGPPCEDVTISDCITPANTGGGGGTGTGPTTGAGYKCVTVKEFCPPGTPKAGAFIRIKSRSCKSCNRGDGRVEPTTIPGSFTPAGPIGGNPAVVTPTQRVEESACNFPNRKATCEAQCPPLEGGPVDQLVAFCNGEPVVPSTRGPLPPPISLIPGTTGRPAGPTGSPPTPPTPGATGRPTGPTTNPPIPGAPVPAATGRPGGPTAQPPILIPNTGSSRIPPAGGDPPIAPTSPVLGQFPIVPQADPNLSLPGPLQSVNLPSQQLLSIQERNATFVNTNEKIISQDNEDLKNLNFNQNLYHPELNFFKSTPDDSLIFVTNNKHLDIFSNQIDITINRVLELANTSAVWNEKDFINLTNEKIEKSLNSDLLIAFKIIRFPGGEVVGLDNLLNSLRKHLVTGTLSKFDANFYVDVARSQLQQNFTILEPADSPEYASRFSIDYISENGESLVGDKTSEAQAIQLNRGRVLNEDLDMKIKVDTITSSTTISVPNEGVLLSAIETKTDSTPVSVGKSDLLNTGDGGGYYFFVSGVNDNIPLRTESLVDKSFYLPDFEKSKVLSLNNKSFVATIQASSLPDKHEFISGDEGAESFEPLYFGINLSSVSSSYGDDPLIENYTATYSRIVDTNQIARHVNNNAQSLSEFRIGYDDPLYRYILDTSSFTLTQEDLTIYGFKNSSSSLDFNFPKNIPFAVLILPVAGSKFNPLNAQSTLTTFTGDTFVRSLDFKPSIGDFIDKSKGTTLKRFNLFNRDGSKRIGLVEKESVQSFGYEYDASQYQNTLYDGSSYTSSIEPVSSFGIAFLMRDVLDYLDTISESREITWFDIYSRMPFNRFSELFFTSPAGIFEEIKNGFRKGLKPDFVLKGRGDQESLIIPEDSKTVVKVIDRRDTSKEKL